MRRVNLRSCSDVDVDLAERCFRTNLQPVLRDHHIAQLAVPRVGRVEYDVAVGYPEHGLHVGPNELLRLFEGVESVRVVLVTKEPDEVLLARLLWHARHAVLAVEDRMEGALGDVVVDQDDVQRSAYKRSVAFGDQHDYSSFRLES